MNGHIFDTYALFGESPYEFQILLSLQMTYRTADIQKVEGFRDGPSYALIHVHLDGAYW